MRGGYACRNHPTVLAVCDAKCGEGRWPLLRMGAALRSVWGACACHHAERRDSSASVNRGYHGWPLDLVDGRLYAVNRQERASPASIYRAAGVVLTT